jgi:hypothetical protein
LQEQQSLLLPVTHFLVTFTLPAELRAVARSNQKTIYNLLFRASSAALQQLALDPRFVGGRLGMVGVLHTWTRQLLYHPHIHYIVTGGGLTADGRWRSSRPDFLVPVKALSGIFRAKLRDALKKTDLFAQVETPLWGKDWVVHSEPVGSGAQAFQYLAPYIFRVALSNNRLRKLEQGQVTFSYKESASALHHHCLGVHPPFPATRPPATLHQSPLLRLAQPRPASTATESQTTALSYHQQTKECSPKANPAAAAAKLSAVPRAAHAARPARSQRSRPMKLPLPAILLFLLSPATGALLSTSVPYSVCDYKKPASLAGFLYLILNIAHLNGSFPSRDPLSRSPRSLQLTIQTPSNT